MPQPQLPAVDVVPLLDKPQRRKLQVLRPLPHDQMQHDRSAASPAPANKAGFRNRSMTFLIPRTAAGEIFHQGLVELHARVQADVVDARLKAFAAVAGAKASTSAR